MKILVLAGGFDQIALIQELKDRGHIVLLADYFNNPPARQYADIFFQISTLDEEKIYQLAYEEKVHLITTACTDQALLTVARVSERLNLPCYLSTSQALEVTNKCYMKQIFFSNGIKTADFHIIEDESNVQKYVEMTNDYPVIVKPCDCNSSKGVLKISNRTKLVDAIEDAFKLSRSRKVIVEEYIEGKELSIDVWVKCKNPTLLSVSETQKVKDNEENFTIYSSAYPVDMNSKQKKNLEREILKIVEAFDIQDGPLLVQAIVKNDDIYIVEFSRRMGGGTKYKLIEYMSGVNIMKLYVDFVLNGDSELPEIQKSKYQYKLDYLYAYNGTIQKLEGFDETIEDGEAKEVFFYKKIGDKVAQRLTSSDRIAGILIEAKSNEELIAKEKNILSKIKIIDTNQVNIMYLQCFQEG